MRRNNIADELIHLQRYDEARQEILRAIECDKPFGHAAEPWKTFMVLHNLERAVGNDTAALQAREKAVQAFLAYRWASKPSSPLYWPSSQGLATQHWQRMKHSTTTTPM